MYGQPDDSSMWGPTPAFGSGMDLDAARKKSLLALLAAGLAKGGADPNAPMSSNAQPAQQPPGVLDAVQQGPQPGYFGNSAPNWNPPPSPPPPAPDRFDANATTATPSGQTMTPKPGFADRFGDPMTRLRMGAALLQAGQKHVVGQNEQGYGWGAGLTGAADAYEGGQRTAAQKKALIAMQASADPQQGLTAAIAALGKGDPSTALGLSMKRVPAPMTLKDQVEINKPVFGKPGEVPYAPDARGNFKPGAAIADDTKIPTGFRLSADGKTYEVDPNWLKAQIELKKAGKPETSVTVNNPGEGAYEKTIGEDAGKFATRVHGDADMARQQIQQVDQLGDALSGVDYQGFGGSSLINLKRAAKVVGVDLGNADIGSAQVAKAVQSQLALSLRKDMPGQMSNADRDFLVSIPPNINNSKEANAALLTIMRAKAQRQVELETSLNQANPKTLQDFQNWQRQTYSQIVNKPLFSDQLKAMLLQDLAGK